MRQDLLMPRLAEEVEEGTIVSWFVEVGDRVPEGAMVAEVQVQKVSSELRAPFTGQVMELLVAPGGVAVQGAAIAIFETEPAGATLPAADLQAPIPSGAEAAPRAATGPVAGTPPVQVAASPSARRLARERGVDLTQITGTGPGGRIVEADVEAAARVPASPGLTTRVEPLTPMRRSIADRLLTWLQSTAQLTLTAEVDVTDLAELLPGLGSGERKASFTEAVVRACALALRGGPRLGARWSENGLRLPGSIDIAVAVDLPEGLLAPVVRGADTKDLPALGREIAELADRARRGTLQPADLEGAVFTVTNLGASRVDAFTPLLNPPQSAIMGVGQARLRAAVVEGEVVPRMLMVLSLTFDHRVVDGRPGADFLSAVARLLEEPSALLSSP